MLILSRKKEEVFVIAGNIEIRILDIGTDKVKIGIDAPKEVTIIRKELLETEKANREAVKTAGEEDYASLKQIIAKKFE